MIIIWVRVGVGERSMIRGRIVIRIRIRIIMRSHAGLIIRH